MPSIRAAIASIKRPSIAQQHESLLATITDREQRLREAPGLKRSIGDRREQIRANESRLVKLNGALRGYVDSKQWGRHEADTREEIATLKEENVRLSEAIAADEKVLADLASFALPVSADVLRHHHERVSEAQANVGKIRDALEAARGELQAIEATPGPAADLRRQLEAALSGLAIGASSQEEIDALEASLTEAESISAISGAKARRIEATVAGLQARLTQAQADLDRLTSITPALQWEVLRPELGQAETGYRDALDALVQASDRFRALVTLMSGIRPGTTHPPLPEATAALRDPGQMRLAAALEREQERLSALGI